MMHSDTLLTYQLPNPLGFNVANIWTTVVIFASLFLGGGGIVAKGVGKVARFPTP